MNRREAYKRRVLKYTKPPQQTLRVSVYVWAGTHWNNFMERAQWDGLESLATSSPKKKSTQKRLKVPPTGRNIELGEFNFEFSKKETVDPSTLSPVRSSIQEKSEAIIKREDTQKVTSFEKNSSSVSYSGRAQNSHVQQSDEFDSSEEMLVDLTSSSNKSEAETTIQKVKDFIENKRNALKKDTKANTIPRMSSSKRVSRAQQRRPIETGLKPKVSPNQHRKNLRRLIHRIHKLPYNSEWGVEEWHLLQEYLNEWRLSDDDDMLQPFVLSDLFNCTVAELEIRINSLKKFVHWKKRKGGGNAVV